MNWEQMNVAIASSQNGPDIHGMNAIRGETSRLVRAKDRYLFNAGSP